MTNLKMTTFETAEHVICGKCNIKITEHYNGWHFQHNGKHLNTYEAYDVWSKHNIGDMVYFKKYVNSLLTNPNAMKY